MLWNPDLTLLQLGPIAIRWYSTMWLIGLLGAYLIAKHIYNKENMRRETFEPLFAYCFIGILIGARLGHCLFYEPNYFLTSVQGFVEMLLPIRFAADGQWHFTGYQGLASHGGTIGLAVAILLYCRRWHVHPWFVLDTVAIATPVTAACIRLGNLMNSEIIGRPTDLPWAFVFQRVDMLPRHPSQLYEAIVYAMLIALMAWQYRRHRQRMATGYFFGLVITLIFTARLFIECTKENQEAFEAAMPLNMGQLLSIPFIALGLVCVYRALKHNTRASV